MGFGVWEGLQSIGACSEIHLDGFSAREVAYGSFSNIFKDFATSPRSSGGRLAWYLSHFRPGRPNFINISFLGRSKKMRAEKLCRFVVVLCRDLCFSFPLWPNQTSKSGAILMHFVQCSFCSGSFVFFQVSQNFSRLPYHCRSLVTYRIPRTSTNR